ncbi:MAG TPA: glucosyl-3-phosphoglycerate synthase [Acidimicrobiales bacterium]|nr:glucosyl-3-phosphoglycerate synthase [Acidimicrobiales bacterium]
MVRSFHHREFGAIRLAEAKQGRRVSVCLPARDEEATVGGVVAKIHAELMVAVPLVDELVVIDDGSHDATAVVAAAAGADVVATGTEGAGKGQAMWTGLAATTGDLVVFCDADVHQFCAHFVTGLLGPLLLRDDVVFVKGFYDRPLDGHPGEGGRVTELVARPLIAALFPHLGAVAQPLAGECAARREVLERLPFVDGYGVDLGLVIDVAERWGVGAVTQCDLGQRVHRNRPLRDLGPQALAILQVALNRAGLAPEAAAAFGGWQSRLVRPGEEVVTVGFSERPPLASPAGAGGDIDVIGAGRLTA